MNKIKREKNEENNLFIFNEIKIWLYHIKTRLNQNRTPLKLEHNMTK